MKPSSGTARKAVKAKPKATANSSASKPRKATAKAGARAKPPAAISKAAPKARVMKKADAGAKASAGEQDASRLIDQRIRELGDWRGETLARMRTLILESDPEMIEEWKWRGTPVWSQHGIVCTGESYKAIVKLTFARGAALPDPARLFNSSLEGNTRRAIDIPEGTKIDASAFKALVKAAVALNTSVKKR